MRIRALLLLVLVIVSNLSMAADIRVAAASNFSQAMTVLARSFEESTGHQVKLVFGSTGKHYAQVRNGAPFDVFFSADIERPRLLEEEGIAIAGSRFTYAIGKLVLWSPMADYVDSKGNVLEKGEFNYLAIANPVLAPYGRAAKEVLQSRGLWSEMKEKRYAVKISGRRFSSSIVEMPNWVLLRYPR